MVREFTDENFTNEVLNCEMPVLVDFWATGCPPCKMLTPIIEKLSNELSDVCKIGKINVYDNPKITEQYDVKSMPTLLLFKGGKLVAKTMGFQPTPKIKEFILTGIVENNSVDT